MTLDVLDRPLNREGVAVNITAHWPADWIDHLAGIEPGSPLAALRAEREEARRNAQRSAEALFLPAEETVFSRAERAAVGLFVAGLHRQAAVFAFYRDLLVSQPGGLELEAAVIAESRRGLTEGPYGAYPDGPLSVENRSGPLYRVTPDLVAVLGPRLAAALSHAHLLVFHPRDATADHLQALLDAGWDTTGVVTLSQLVAFLTFQIRVVSGLTALKYSLPGV